MKKINVMLSLLLVGVMMGSCKKEATSPAPTYPLNVRMTDAPGPYNAVYIDLQGVEITGSNGKTGLMNVKAGIYNLLDFSNGIDTLIAVGSLNTANVAQMRLILGTNNSVVVNNVRYALSTPSAQQSGLKLEVHQTLQAGVANTILIDFDANKSIVDHGDGTYSLKPVLRTIEIALSGSIKGKIVQEGTLAFATATKDGISYSANVTAKGDFKISGLTPGVYSVVLTPAFPLNPFIISEVTVTAGNTTNIGTVMLQ